jgi:hypothetical protein
MRTRLALLVLGLLVTSSASALPGDRQRDRRDSTQRLNALRKIAQRSNTQQQPINQVQRLKSSFYKPVAFHMEVPDNLGRQPMFEDVIIHKGLDGRSPSQAVERVRSKLATPLHPSNVGLIQKTALITHKAFTLAVNNAFIEGSPANRLIKGELAGADVSILGVMSQVQPTVLMAKVPGERTARFYAPTPGGGYQRIEKLSYSVVMKARLEKGVEGGVRVSYHQWNHPALAGETTTVTEIGSRGGN